MASSRAVVLLTGSVLLGGVVPAGAQVRYAYPEDVSPLDVPYEPQGARPSYEIYPFVDGGPVVRVSRRCAYPNGWNVTDFSRDVNGIPAGIDHVCPTDLPKGRRVRGR